MQHHPKVTGTLRRSFYGLIIFCFTLLSISCSTTPNGRTQMAFLGAQEMADMGTQSFEQMKQQMKISKDPALNSYVQCVAHSVLNVMQTEEKSWEIVVFEDPTPNAFALPGGHIGVHTGLLKAAVNQDQLAAVLGHEIGHVLAHHSNERVSQTMVTQGLLSVAQVALDGRSQKSQLMLAALGLGAQYGVLLPFSRKQESEADELGVKYMAQAGYNPNESVALWNNMKALGGGAPPEFLSTHPSPDSRISALTKLSSQVYPSYQAAISTGRRPNCQK